MGSEAAVEGAITFGLGLQLVRDGLTGREAGERPPSLAFLLPWGLLLGLPRARPSRSQRASGPTKVVHTHQPPGAES